MIKLALTILFSGYILMGSVSAYAHVLITDDTNSRGAILHIFPDDDPIAGEESILYFDTQNSLSNSGDSVSLTVTDESGIVQSVETNTEGSLSTANFIFPSQGLYQIKYLVVSNGNTYVFNQSQRVSRGVTNSTFIAPSYNWAEMLLVSSGIAAALLIVVGFNNRKDIIKHSKLG